MNCVMREWVTVYVDMHSTYAPTGSNADNPDEIECVCIMYGCNVCILIASSCLLSSSSSSSSSGMVAQLFVVPPSNDVTRLSGVPNNGTAGCLLPVHSSHSYPVSHFILFVVNGTISVFPLSGRLGGGGESDEGGRRRALRIDCEYDMNGMLDIYLL